MNNFDEPVQHVNFKTKNSYPERLCSRLNIKSIVQYATPENDSNNKNPIIIPTNDFYQTATSPNIYRNTEDQLIRLLQQSNKIPDLQQVQTEIFSKFNSADPAKKAKCRVCKNIKISVKLACGHTSCITCLKNKINTLLASPSISTYKNCRCSVCLFLVTEKDLKKIYGNESQDAIKMLNTLDLSRNCSLCKRSLNIIKCFLPELDCLHLCRDCYTTELKFGIRSCLACSSPFNNKDLTNSREVTCQVCQASRPLVSFFCKAFHEDHIQCFRCLSATDFSGAEVICQVCNLGVINRDFKVFLYHFNKLCPLCNETKCIQDFNICQKCSFFACDTCVPQRPCQSCGN